MARTSEKKIKVCLFNANLACVPGQWHFKRNFNELSFETLSVKAVEKISLVNANASESRV